MPVHVHPHEDNCEVVFTLEDSSVLLISISFCVLNNLLLLQVIEYALNTTNGQEPKNLVPISTRHPLITSWVFCKQLLNQQMPKNLGHDDEVSWCCCVG